MKILGVIHLFRNNKGLISIVVACKRRKYKMIFPIISLLLSKGNLKKCNYFKAISSDILLRPKHSSLLQFKLITGSAFIRQKTMPYLYFKALNQIKKLLIKKTKSAKVTVVKHCSKT